VTYRWPTTGVDEALLSLGLALKAADYHFVAVTPATHLRVLQRDTEGRGSLRDIFGWNRSFEPRALPPELLALANAAGVVSETPHGLRMRLRFATLGGELFAHSGFPTLDHDAVFFGPDTYRFVDFVKGALGATRSLVDVGCGSGAAGIVAASSCERVTLTDLNVTALRFARLNAALARTPVTLLESDILTAVLDPVDVVIANPPYMRDPAHRLYRDGGGAHGEALSLRIAREALSRLERGGRLLLYTGAAMIDGQDLLRDDLEKVCDAANASFCYRELDPDVFGEQLEELHYENVDRIAAVGLIAVLR
jgi:SAM-dependent methyltransferase